MKGYQQYMSRQQVSPDLHCRLLALEQTVPVSKPRPRRVRWQSAALLAACLCLVLGLSWGGLTGRFSMGSGNAGAAADNAAAQTTESSQAPEAAQTAENAGGADQGSEPTQDAPPESGSTQETEGAGLPQTEEAGAEDVDGESVFPLPSWLPEGYVLTQSQTWEDGSKLSMTWENSQGEQITLTYETVPQASDWPTYPWEEAGWDTLSQIAPQDGLWGFCLQGQDLWLECTTTGDQETLWQVVQSIPQP